MLLHIFTNILVKKFFGNNLVLIFVKYLIKYPYYKRDQRLEKKTKTQERLKARKKKLKEDQMLENLRNTKGLKT